MILPQLTTCCCCCSTETGTKIIGWFQTISDGLSTIAIACLLITSSTSIGIYDSILLIHVVFHLFMALLGVLLLIGVYKLHLKYVKAWVMISAVILCVGVFFIFIWILLMIIMSMYNLLPVICSQIISSILSAYFILVVYSYYRDQVPNARSNDSITR